MELLSATFTYDSEGKRLTKTIDGATTQFVYDDINSREPRRHGVVELAE